MTAKNHPRVVPVDMINNKRQTPLKGPDHAVIVAVVISAFAPVHVIFPGNQILPLYLPRLDAGDEGVILKTTTVTVKRGALLIDMGEGTR